MNTTSDTKTFETQPASGTVKAPADNVLNASGELDAGRVYTELRLSGGQVVRVPTALLLDQAASGSHSETPAALARESPRADTETVIPVIEERLEIGKRVVATGRVVVEKQIQEYHETLDVPLAVRSFDIERVVLNRAVNAAPPVRQEGDTTIYSLVEEQLVLTTQLVLKEEVRVTKRDTERRDTRTVTLKRETLSVTRLPVEPKS